MTDSQLMRKTAFIYSPELEKYPYPADHPFNTIRAQRTREVLDSMELLTGDGKIEAPPRPARRMAIKKFHTARYLHALRDAAKKSWDAEAFAMGIGTEDCPVFDGLYEYATLATGATLVGVKLILSGDVDVAFNPSGGFHHAGPEQAAGFCYINDVALACAVLAEQGKRVLYLDVDVHHGDGVANGFYDRWDVMTMSFHQNPKTLFPGTGFADEIGDGDGKGYCVNVPLPIGTYDQAYMEAFDAIAPPLITAYDPDVIVLQLGADALADDPLAHLCLTNNVYARIIECILSYDKPILATGGGGYDIGNTVRAWALAWTVLCAADNNEDSNLPTGSGLRDDTLEVSDAQRETVTPAVKSTIELLRKNIFPIHGL